MWNVSNSKYCSLLQQFHPKKCFMQLLILLSFHASISHFHQAKHPPRFLAIHFSTNVHLFLMESQKHKENQTTHIKSENKYTLYSPLSQLTKKYAVIFSSQQKLIILLDMEPLTNSVHSIDLTETYTKQFYFVHCNCSPVVSTSLRCANNNDWIKYYEPGSC